MLAVVGYGSIDDLFADALPTALRDNAPLHVPPASDEAEVTAESERLEAEYDKHRLAELIQAGGVAGGPALPPAHDETPGARSNGGASDATRQGEPA